MQHLSIDSEQSPPTCRLDGRQKGVLLEIPTSEHFYECCPVDYAPGARWETCMFYAGFVLNRKSLVG